MTYADKTQELLGKATKRPWRQPFPTNAPFVVDLCGEGGFDLRHCPDAGANAALIVHLVNSTDNYGRLMDIEDDETRERLSAKYHRVFGYLHESPPPEGEAK